MEEEEGRGRMATWAVAQKQAEESPQVSKLTPDSAVHTLRAIKLGVPGTERRDGECAGFMESGERNFSAELTVM